MKGKSITVKTRRIVEISCLLLGAIALIVGLNIYGSSLVQQYVSHAYGIASHAAGTGRYGVESEAISKETMRFYRELTPEQRAKTGTEEYRSYFAAIDTEPDGGEWDVLVHMMKNFVIDVDDVYLAMYDEETGAVVYIADADTEDPILYPGDWEPAHEREMKKFLAWDGTGMLYDINRTEKYGWTCTAGYPVRDGNEETYAFLFADVSVNSVARLLKSYALKIAVGVLLVTVFIAWFSSRRMKRTIVDPVIAVTNAASAYAEGRKSGTDERYFAGLDFHSNDEMENLSRVMADMELDLADHEARIRDITAEKERINTELDMAGKIQASMLPDRFPAFPDRCEFDLYATMDPAREVGGDFYDFFLIDEDHLGLLIADVSGKGVPAALFMMIAKVILQSCAMLGRSPGEILTKTNEALCSSNKTQMFVTVWMGILEISTGTITAANAGHEYPALSQDGPFALLKDRHGFVVGGMDGTQYQEYEIRMKPGDRLFLYTDGVPEATDAEECMFGLDRMLASLNREPGCPPKRLLGNVKEDVNRFAGEAEQFDDMTMLCLEYRGAPAPAERREEET